MIEKLPLKYITYQTKKLCNVLLKFRYIVENKYYLKRKTKQYLLSNVF